MPAGDQLAACYVLQAWSNAAQFHDRLCRGLHVLSLHTQPSPAQHSMMCCRTDLDELSFSQHLVRGRQAWGVHNVQVCLQVASGQVARLAPHLSYLIPAQVVRAGSTCTCTLSISTWAHRVYSKTTDGRKVCGKPAANSGMRGSSPYRHGDGERLFGFV